MVPPPSNCLARHADLVCKYRVCLFPAIFPYNGWIGTLRKDSNMKEHKKKRKKIVFFGHFDSTNFGNESTLQAIIYNLRCYQPDAELVCISTGPEATVANHHIEAIAISKPFSNYSPPR